MSKRNNPRTHPSVDLVWLSRAVDLLATARTTLGNAVPKVALIVGDDSKLHPDILAVRQEYLHLGEAIDRLSALRED